MTAFVLIPGAGGDASYWSRVRPLLEDAGHSAVAVDLPGPDPNAGLEEYVARAYFLHDVDLTGLPADVPDESEAVFGSRCTFTTWPSGLRVLVGADDRFFPPEFQVRVALDRLGVTAKLRPGGHLIALAQPKIVADYLLEKGD